MRLWALRYYRLLGLGIEAFISHITIWGGATEWDQVDLKTRSSGNREGAIQIEMGEPLGSKLHSKAGPREFLEWDDP